MLVLTRKIDERIQIGPNITVTILRIKGRSVQIGIDAPGSVQVLRGEIASLIDQRGVAAEPIQPMNTQPAKTEPHNTEDTCNQADAGPISRRRCMGQPRHATRNEKPHKASSLSYPAADKKLRSSVSRKSSRTTKTM